MLYQTNPTQTDPIVATTYFFALHASCPLSLSLSLCVCLSNTVKLDRYSLLPLSLVSLSRNRTKGGRRSSGLCWGFDMKSVLSELMERLCMAVRGGVCVFTYGVFVSVWWSQRSNAGSVRHHTKASLAKTACRILI